MATRLRLLTDGKNLALACDGSTVALGGVAWLLTSGHGVAFGWG
jgi:hypothetical protein